MKARIPLLLCFALFALSAVPASAAAQDSGVKQYREGVPDGGGDKTGVDAGDSEPSVDEGTREALSASGGDDGVRLADIADATAPKHTNRNDKSARSGKSGKDGKGAEQGSAGQDAVEEAAGDSTEQEVRSSLGSGPGGLGLGLPALMLVGLAVALAIRFRASSLGKRS